MIRIKLSDIMKVLIERDYRVYTRPNELNIIGIRSTNTIPNFFDDLIFVFWRNKNANRFESRRWLATTDPGLYWLNNPDNIDGTAILFPGQYLDCYKLDLHKGKYLALCQRLGPVKVWRDSNKDDRFNPDKTDFGMFGINIHKASKFTDKVNKWSAGCQVFKNEEDYDQFLILCQGHQALYENIFTYTLLREADFLDAEIKK